MRENLKLALMYIVIGLVILFTTVFISEKIFGDLTNEDSYLISYTADQIAYSPPYSHLTKQYLYLERL